MKLKYLGQAAAVGLLAACAQTVQVGSRPGGEPISSQASSSPLVLGRELFSRQEYALAIAKFNEAVRDEPDKPDGYNALASSYDMIGRFDISQRYYEQALARAPLDGRIYRNMARSLRMQGREGEALAVLAEWDAASADTVKTSATTPPGKSALGEGVQSAASDDPKLKPPPYETSVAPKVLPVEVRAGVMVSPASSALQSQTSVTISIPPARGYAPNAANSSSVSQSQSSAMAAIRIMNGVGKRGLARGVQTWLAQSGWSQSRTGDLDRRFQRSYIVFPSSAQAQALTLSRQLPFTTSKIVSERATRVVLILGKNAVAVDLRRISAKASAG